MSELIETHRFIVERAYGSHDETYDSRGDSMIVVRGGYSNSAGYQTIITVDVADNPTGIKRLFFNGGSPVKRKDIIDVIIPKHETKIDGYDERDRPKHLHFPRKQFQEEERALVIKIYDSDGAVSRVDLSTDYPQYRKG